jgi:hypothetical protein
MGPQYTEIYSAIYKMRPTDKEKYIAAWVRRHPGREDILMDEVIPYLDPPGMLFSAPPTNPVLSLVNIIARMNDLPDPTKRVNVDAPLCTCEDCGLLVTHVHQHRILSRGICLKCYEDWINQDLDVNE